MIENNAIAAVTVGVEDINEALDLWQNVFQFTLRTRKAGSDHDLSDLWRLEEDSITDQALLYTPGLEMGYLHLVEFKNPFPPIRRNAAISDLCPKNIDVACTDLPTRFKELKELGFKFRSDWVQYEAAGHVVREVQMHGHDDTNIGYLDIRGQDYPFTKTGYAGLSCIVSIVPDVALEEEFYKHSLSLPSAGRHVLDGPEFEKMVGLPPGGSMDLRLLSEPDNIFGRVELIEYVGLNGKNLYPLAKPGALGMFQEVFFAKNMEDFLEHLVAKNINFKVHDKIKTVFSSGKVCVLSTPAGKRIEVHERF